jgi:hypothetical protein
VTGEVRLGADEYATVPLFPHPNFSAGQLQRSELAVEVRTTSLEASSTSIERATLVCNIQGTEVKLVRHEADVLADRIDTLIVEVHPWIIGQAAIDAMLQRLEKVAFRAFAKQGTTSSCFRNLGTVLRGIAFPQSRVRHRGRLNDPKGQWRLLLSVRSSDRAERGTHPTSLRALRTVNGHWTRRWIKSCSR